MESKVMIGNLLVEAGIISVKTLERSLELQIGTGKRLGALLRDMGLVSEEEVMEALARQCNLRTVRNFAEQAFPRELLDLVPAKLALEKIIFPLKKFQDVLALATLDPFDQETFKRVAAMTGMMIYPVLATRDDIVLAVKRNYAVGRWSQGGRQRILLVDPSPIVTDFLKAPLEKEGYHLFIAHDGVDGLKLAFTSQPDLVVCDQMMPRMDSYMFISALKTRPATKKVPVILLSSKNSGEEENFARRAGFVDNVVKPAMPIRLLASIKKALAPGKESGDPSVGNSSRPAEQTSSQRPQHALRRWQRRH
jgi:CheY-like chemotaxis protein